MGGLSFFSSLSIVIPARKDEPADWVQAIVQTARSEAAEIVLVIERDADPIAMRPSVSGAERVRIIIQPGTTKADALNLGLQTAKNPFVVFLDADVRLEAGQLSIVRKLLDETDFVSVAYGQRPPPFPVISFVSGWFFGAKRSTFIEIGGWADDFVEDVQTARRILQAGYTIRTAPFAVKLRRPVRNPIAKGLSTLHSSASAERTNR